MQIALEYIEIPAEKITAYLLVAKEKNDKSHFLANLGYTLESWRELEKDIKNLVIEARLFCSKKRSLVISMR